jgi:hypothetical protein
VNIFRNNFYYAFIFGFPSYNIMNMWRQTPACGPLLFKLQHWISRDLRTEATPLLTRSFPGSQEENSGDNIKVKRYVLLKKKYGCIRVSVCVRVFLGQ